MKLKDIGELNTERFLDEAFSPKHNATMIKAARRRRNIYLGLFLAGVVCIFITAFSNQIVLCILSLGLATLSLVVMTKYDTQLSFLRIIQLRSEEDGDDYSNTPASS